MSERDTAPGVRLVTSSSRFGCRSFLPSLIHSLRLPRGSVRHLTPPSLRSPKAVKRRGVVTRAGVKREANMMIHLKADNPWP